MPWGSDWHRGSQDVRPARSRRTFFDGTTFPHFLRFTTGRPGGDVRARVNLFGGVSFPHALGIGLAPRKLGGKARAESLHSFRSASLPAVQEVTSVRE